MVTDLIEALRRMKIETGSFVCLGCGYENSCSTRGCAIIRAAVDALTEAQSARVVHGHWVDESMSGPLSFSGTCSVCGFTNDIPHPYLAHYCPTCGAKMDGGDDDAAD